MKIEQIYELMLDEFKSGNTLTFPINGTSMRPLLKSNYLVEVKNDLSLRKNDIIFYRRDDGSFVLHRIVKIKGDFLYIMGDHQTSVEILSFDHVIAKAISYTKNNKKHYFKGFKYNVYLILLKSKLIRKIFKMF